MPCFAKSLLGAVAALSVLIVLFGLDRWIVLRCDRFQQRRLIASNYVGVFLFLIPVALRCVKGSWANTLCDLICFSVGVCLVAYGLAARIEPLLGKKKVFRQAPVILFPIILGVYGMVLGWQLIALYNAYGIEWADFAFEFPPFWQGFRTWPFRMIDLLSFETNMLKFHWPLIYLPLAPVTFLWKDPRVTLVVLTLFFTITGYAVYLLALQHTGRKNVASVVGMAFMAYLPVHCAHLSGLHADPLAMPFIFLSFYFAEKQAWKRYWVMVGLALICKEYVGLVYAGYGVYLAMKNRNNGIATALAGLAWFFFVVKIGIPLFNRGDHPWVMNMNYGNIGGNGGIGAMAVYCLTHPGEWIAVLLRPNNIVAFVSLLLPFAFIPLTRPLLLAAGVLIVLKNALSASGIDLLTHRETLFIPFVVYALISFIGSLQTSSRRIFYCCAVSISVVITFLAQGHAFPARGFWVEKERYKVTEHERTIDTMVSMVPPDVPVMASSHITPRLMMRKWYFLFPEFPAPVEPVYILVDTLKQKEYDWYPLQKQHDALQKIVRENHYTIIKQKDGVILLRRNDADVSAPEDR